MTRFTATAAPKIISIHALREEGDAPAVTLERRQRISIHALREEGDLCGEVLHVLVVQFLSTPSARRATGLLCVVYLQAAISIHALREEGDFH